MEGNIKTSKNFGYGKKYLIIKGKGIKNNYEIDFLKHNEVDVLLPFYTIEKNGELEYWYDITGKKSIEEYVKENGVELNVLFNIFSYAKIALNQLSEYLINEKHIIIQKDTMFLKDSKMYLCYYPEETKARRGFSDIGECLIENTDSNNSELIKVAYSLYQEMLNEDFRVEDALSMLSKEQVKIDSENIENNNFDINSYDSSSYDNEDNNLSSQDVGPIDIYLGENENIIENDELNQNGGMINIKNSLKISPSKEKSSYVSGKKIAGTRLDTTVGEEEDSDSFIYKFKLKYKEINNYFDKMFKRIYPDDEEEINDINAAEDLSQPYIQAKLLYDGNEGEEDFLLNKSVFMVGSDKKKSNAVLHSKKISKHHSKIIRKGKNFYLTDWNSRHGTYLNGQRLKKGEKVALKSMDRICFADVPYRFA